MIRPGILEGDQRSNIAELGIRGPDVVEPAIRGRPDVMEPGIRGAEISELYVVASSVQRQ